MENKTGITNLDQLILNMEPILNKGEYVFVSLPPNTSISRDLTICEIKEKEGITAIIRKQDAVQLGLSFEFVAAWITLNIHSSLAAIGLTAAFSSALAQHNISCNVVAAYYHDHIFVDIKDKNKALSVLRKMSIQKKH